MQLTTDFVLTRGVERVLPTKEGLAKLMETKKISLYEGFDPTSPSLHIGHLIGIPTDKTATRQKLTHEQMLAKLKSYKEQVKNVIDFEGKNPVKIMFNYDW